MQEKLFIYLHTNDLENPSWGTTSYTHRGETETLSQVAQDRDVILIVPAEDVVLLNVKLPKMNRSRLLQALPFALEEQVMGEVEDLHFAVADYLPDGQLPVAIVSHAKMKQWLSLLQSWNVMASVIIPATLMLPCENSVWHVLLHEMAIVRTGIFEGFAVDRNNFPAVLSLALEANGESPQQLQFSNYTNEKYAEKLEALTPITEHFLQTNNLMSDLIKLALKNPSLNLLQGMYSVKKAKFPIVKMGAKIVFYLISAWALVLFIYPTVSFFILKNKINFLDTHINEIYQHHFPQATNIIAPKLRMQQRLQSLSRHLDEHRPLTMMALIGKVELVVPSIKLKHFDFQNERLSLELIAATPEDFSAFTDYLIHQGLKVKQQNADLVEGRMRAMLQIE